MRIKELRCSAGLTQGELARLIGVSRVTIANWELGRRHPPVQSLPLIANTLNCSVGELYGDSEEKSSEVTNDMSESKANVTIPVQIDSKEIDAVTEKLTTLISLLREANSLLNELASKQELKLDIQV